MHSGQSLRGFAGASMRIVRYPEPTCAIIRRCPPRALRHDDIICCPSPFPFGLRKWISCNATRPQRWKFLQSLSHPRTGATRVVRSVVLNSSSRGDKNDSCGDDNGKSSSDDDGAMGIERADVQQSPSVSTGPNESQFPEDADMQETDGLFVFQRMVQIWAATLPLAFGGAEIFAELKGISAAELAAYDQATGSAVAQGAQLLAVLWLLRGGPGSGIDSPTASMIRPTPAALAQGLAGGAVCIAGVGVVLQLGVILAGATGGTGAGDALDNSNSASAFVAAMIPSSSINVPVPAVVQAAVLGPVTEELIYRGFLLTELLRLGLSAPSAASSGSPSVMASAFVFAGAHLSLGQLLPLTTLGALLGAVHIRAGSNLAAPILAHAIYNAVVLASYASTAAAGSTTAITAG